jgi:hypothetical protein
MSLYEDIPPPISGTTSLPILSSQNKKEEKTVTSGINLLAPALRRKAVATSQKTKTQPKPKLTNIQKNTISSNSSSVFIAHSLVDSTEDVYDPMFPNEYEQYLEERSKRKDERGSIIVTDFKIRSIVNQLCAYHLNR